MLKLKKIGILFVVVVAATLVHAQPIDSLLIPELQQASLPEKYTKKVLIEAKWGEGPGEFQLEPINETHEWQTFIVLDKGGNIYRRP